MKLLSTNVEVNEPFIPDFGITYDIYFSHQEGHFEARLSEEPKEHDGLHDIPRLIRYDMVKPFDLFTQDEKEKILSYSGLNIEDHEVQPLDIFMEACYIKLKSVIY